MSELLSCGGPVLGYRLDAALAQAASAAYGLVPSLGASDAFASRRVLSSRVVAARALGQLLSHVGILA